MGETTADVRRDIELTRERMSDTLNQLEDKVNVLKVVREHPWPAIALAAGAGFVLARSKTDVKAAAAAVSATGGASSKVAAVLDDLAARIITEVTDAANQRVDAWVNELKEAIGAAGAALVEPSQRRPSRERQVERPVMHADSTSGGDGSRVGEAATQPFQEIRAARGEGMHH